MTFEISVRWVYGNSDGRDLTIRSGQFISKGTLGRSMRACQITWQNPSKSTRTCKHAQIGLSKLNDFKGFVRRFTVAHERFLPTSLIGMPDFARDSFDRGRHAVQRKRPSRLDSRTDSSK